MCMVAWSSVGLVTFVVSSCYSLVSHWVPVISKRWLNFFGFVRVISSTKNNKINMLCKKYVKERALIKQ